jgi:DNA (cytosine-5)-methyltransferase 1
MLRSIEFFAGSGLVQTGLASDFKSLWANDNSLKKRETFIANHGDATFFLGDIKCVKGMDIPAAHLAWASFPCQDLSLAGNLTGMGEGTRSGLFWEWIRILWELRHEGKLPPVLAAENVTGFIVADGGKHFKQAYGALKELGYRVGAVTMNASAFVPQSRPRAFLIAVRDGIDLSGLIQPLPSPKFHSPALVRSVKALDDPKWVWWSLPIPAEPVPIFRDLCDRDAPFDPVEQTERLCDMLSPLNKRKLDALKKLGTFFAGTAYRRTRPDEYGRKVQRLEIRFDGLAGCLRTPDGGSSRQTVIVVDKGVVRSRLMTVRECARLMGAPDSYKVEGTYNDGYRAMGDAVAVPVTRWLARHLLGPLAYRATGLEERIGSCRKESQAVPLLLLRDVSTLELAHNA